MSMLIRYKKNGGFVQLVKLLEGFGKEKREKFLDLVKKEDAVWAAALQDKLLDLDRIFNWDTQTVANICQRMHEKNLAALMHGLSEDQKNKVYELMGHSEKRRLNTYIDEMTPSPGEISTGVMKLIEETREMIQTGHIKLDSLDPSLMIEEDIEEHLATATNYSSSPYHKKADENGDGLDFGMAEHLGGVAAGAGVDAKEYETLKRKVINLTKEVNLLKRENKVMSEKLAQIKKIA